MTKELEKRFASVGRQWNNPKVILKLFTPWTYWSRYISEYEAETKICFGFTQGHYWEWGYISLEELEEIKWPYGLKVERDIHFGECFFYDLKI